MTGSSGADSLPGVWFHDVGAGRQQFPLKGGRGSDNPLLKSFPHGALPCLFPEIVGQTCYYNVYRKNAVEQKVAILYGFDYQNIGVVDEVAYKKNFATPEVQP